VNTPPIVSPEEWQTAWENLLVKEKELTRARDALAAERRRMPWMAVEKDYRFEGPDGPATCSRAGASWSSTAPSTRRMSPRTHRRVARTRSGPAWAAPSAQTRLRTLPT
jgi:hypothetical protein